MCNKVKLSNLQLNVVKCNAKWYNEVDNKCVIHFKIQEKRARIATPNSQFCLFCLFVY